MEVPGCWPERRSVDEDDGTSMDARDGKYDDEEEEVTNDDDGAEADATSDAGNDEDMEAHSKKRRVE